MDDNLLDEIELNLNDTIRIRDRAEKLSKARLVADGLLHLKKEERQRLETVLHGMQIAMPGDVDCLMQQRGFINSAFHIPRNHGRLFRDF